MDSFVKLLVLDREAAARFYEGLGFTRVASDATFAHLRWAEHGNLAAGEGDTRDRARGAPAAVPCGGGGAAAAEVIAAGAATFVRMNCL